jgi:hypothetical protein
LQKYSFLGKVNMLSYQKLCERIQGKEEILRKIQAKKLKAQQEYENKETNLSEI